MKNEKMARKTGARLDYILRPVRWRVALIYAIFFALAVLAGLSIRVAFNANKESFATLFSDWYFNFIIVIGGSILFALLDYSRWTIRVINGDRIEGPTGAFGERAELPLKEIDWTRSSRSLNSRLKVGNAIYTLTRKRILISPWFYKQEDFKELLDYIGYKPKQD